MTNIVIVSLDNKEFCIPIEVANMSETIKHLIEDTGVDIPIPIPNVDQKILTKIIEYCQYHVNPPTTDPEEVKNWDQAFVTVDQDTLFSLILASNYLDIKPLLDLTCQTVANSIKGKTPEQVRQIFNIKNDFTPEEEEQVRRENEWCEER